MHKGKPVASASGKGGGNRSDNVIVGTLVCMLLLLLLLLFLAWRHLSHLSEGTYHPQRVMRGLVTRLQDLWRQTRREELSQGYGDDDDVELGEQQEEEEDTEDEHGKQREAQLPQQPDNEQEEEGRQEMLDVKVEPEPTEKADTQEPTEDEPSRAAEGSTGVLFSDLHSFSGTAAWEDGSKLGHATDL